MKILIDKEDITNEVDALELSLIIDEKPSEDFTHMVKAPIGRELSVQFKDGTSSRYHCGNINPISTKPKRTKPAFEQVDPNKEGGKYWECVRDFAESWGETAIFHYLHRGSYWPIDDNDRLLKEYKLRNLYRKVEKEITELEEFMEEALKYGERVGGLTRREERLVKKLFSAGCRFNLIGG